MSNTDEKNDSSPCIEWVIEPIFFVWICLVVIWGGREMIRQTSGTEPESHPQVVSMGTQTMLRGMAIMMVILGHSLALIIGDLAFGQQIAASIAAKFTAPCVFFFVFLIGYGQGVKKHRLSKPQLIQRVRTVLYPYLFWASLSFLLYIILKDPYWYPFTGQDLYGGFPVLVQYLFSLSSFTVSWQYYFLALFLFFQWYAYRIRSHSERKINIWSRSFLIFHIAYLSVISFLLWFAPRESLPLGVIGAMIYPNPISWGLVFYLGFGMGMSKIPIIPYRRLFLPLYFALWAFGSFELAYMLQKWGTALVTDQFTLSGFLFALVSLSLFLRIAAMWSNRLSNGEKSWWRKWVMRFGKHSLLIFMIHLPFQWFILLALEQWSQMEFPVFLRVGILFSTGLLLPYLIGEGSKKLPIPFRKVLTGF